MRQLEPLPFRPANVPRSEAWELVVFEQAGLHVMEGMLRGVNSGVWFPITRGVPCFLTGALRPDLHEFYNRYGLNPADDTQIESAAIQQAKTAATFSDKWRRFQSYGLEATHQDFLMSWYCKKFGLEDRSSLVGFYRDRGRVLEVGSGSGFNTRFIA
jgi:uncharacterized protein YbaR (Trm112 family)